MAEDGNTWPGGYRHAILPSKHEKWNAGHYPGTRQLCSVCDEPTGRCEEDAIWSEDGEPLCEECYDSLKEPTMPESDLKLCARLAEWRGWPVFTATCPEWRTQLSDAGFQCVLFISSPAELRLYDGQRFIRNWHPDTDPVAALELLGWLAKRGWSYICGWDQADGDQRFCRLWKHTDAPDRKGVRRIVITQHAVDESEAIALAADEVRGSEASDA